MKLYFDIGNINACKVLIARELSEVALDEEIVKSDVKVASYFTSSRLPVLEISPDVLIFSSNSACRYIWGLNHVDHNVTSTDTWLDWEATQLKPAVQILVTSGSSGSGKTTALADIRNSLEHLKTMLKSDNAVGTEVRPGAVVVWSAVYPLFSDVTPFKELRTEFPTIATWFDHLTALPAFKNPVKKIFPEALSWNSLCTALSSHLVLTGRALDEKSTNKQVSAGSGIDGTAGGVMGSGTTAAAVSREEMLSAEQTFLNGLHATPLKKHRLAPLLPQAGERNLLVTSALPYVNNVPHLGNIIGCVLSADVYARFCRLRDYNILYICGTDEYGTATETKAIEEGLTPQQICDKYHALHVDVYRWFNIAFDYFGRTTTQQQTKIAQDIFWRLQENGFVIKDDIEQLQCVNCNRFLADRFVEGICPFCAADDARGDQCDRCGKLINAIELKQPKCKLCRSTPIVKSSSHLFLDLPRLEPRLTKHLDRVFDDGLWTSNAKMITRSWIRDGLKPRCISRDLKWGTPVPLEGYTDKVFYVWYDAPIGYISITANYTDQWELWWKNPSQVDLFNFMAKDNVPFHSVIFPCSLLGTGEPWTVVNNMSATEYLNYEDGKFSKSRGLGVFGDNAKDAGIPADVFRFYLLYVRPESQDSVFSWEDLMLKNNGELLNNLGNFVNRTLTFVTNNFSSRLSAIVLTDEDRELVVLVSRELTRYIDNLEQIKLRDGIRNILAISTLGNGYIQASKPWVLVKGSDTDKARAGSVLSLAVNIAYLLSILVSPYMPELSSTIQGQLNAKGSSAGGSIPDHVLTDRFIQYLPTGHQIGEPKVLFQKIEPPLVAALQAKYGGKQFKPATEGTALATPVSNGAATPEPQQPEGDKTITELTKECEQQGEVVRKLKAAKADKSAIDSEVKKLLALKAQLATASGVTSTPPAAATTAGGGSGQKKKGKK